MKPVNPDYIPNLKKNVWPQLQSPFYDVGSQYTVPYTIYRPASAGAATRSRRTSPSSRIPGRSSGTRRNTRAMSACSTIPARRWAWRCSMRRTTTSTPRIPRIIDKALADLKALIPICNPKINITEYQTLPEGTSWLHQVLVGRYAQRASSPICPGTAIPRAAYWSPPRGKGPIQNDCWAVSRRRPEAGAGPSLPEPHPRRAGRLRQFRRTSPAISRRRTRSRRMH